MTVFYCANTAVSVPVPAYRDGVERGDGVRREIVTHSNVPCLQYGELERDEDGKENEKGAEGKVRSFTFGSSYLSAVIGIRQPSLRPLWAILQLFTMNT